jgi:hypothetical protein
VRKSLRGTIIVISALAALAACTENPEMPMVNGVPVTQTPMGQPPVVILPPVHVK